MSDDEYCRCVIFADSLMSGPRTQVTIIRCGTARVGHHQLFTSHHQWRQREALG